LGTVGGLVGFAESASFVFDDFDRLSAPDAYYTRLCDHIRLNNDAQKKLQAEYQKFRGLSGKLHGDLKKAQSDGQALGAQLTPEKSKSSSLEADRSRLESDLRETRGTAESRTQEMLATIGAVANFGASPSFVFSDFDSLSSPESFVSRLAEHIRATQSNLGESSKKLQDELQKLRSYAAKLQTDLKKAQADGETIREQRDNEAKKSAVLESERVRLQSEYAKLQFELQALRAKAESGSCEMLGLLDQLSHFTDAPSFVFADFDSISSPQSYVSRLAQHIRQLQATLSESSKKLQVESQKLRGAFTKVQADLKKFQSDNAGLQKQI
jgi:septal ring factor EnvC (AmiA/AmiB activator)